MVVLVVVNKVHQQFTIQDGQLNGYVIVSFRFLKTIILVFNVACDFIYCVTPSLYTNWVFSILIQYAFNSTLFYCRTNGLYEVFTTRLNYF